MRVKILLLFVLALNVSTNLLNAQRIYNIYWSTLTTGFTENEDLLNNPNSTEGSAVSGNLAASGETGYIEFSNYQTDKTKSIGFAVSGNTTNIDHCFKFTNNTVAIYNGSTLKVTAYTFSKGDRFKISFSGTTMTFYHNGVPKASYTFTNSVLKIKAILTSQNASFSGIKN